MSASNAMTNKDKVLEILMETRDGEGICDDCLAELAGIQPRQTVNSICRELHSARIIERKSGNCSKRNHNVGKLQNFFATPKFTLELVPPQAELMRKMVLPNPRTNEESPAPPTLKDQTNILSQWLFDACSLLGQIDPLHLNDPFASRITRLKAERSIAPSLARKMLTLNNFRVQVVKERKPLDRTEWNLAWKYIGESLSDRNEKGR